MKAITLIILFFCCVQIQSSLAQDSLSIKIGQMILIGFPKAEVDKNVLEEIRQGKVGSIILFEKNVPGKNSYFELKKMIWTYKKAAPIPLIVAIDQEGGRVNRLKEKYGFPRSLSAANLGKMPLDSIRFYSQSTAATLAGLGFTMNFAPVVDLATNPDNPIIAKVERSYSKSADSVILFAREFIREHQKVGVLTSLKHFPGHGSSKDDTHLGLTDVTQTWSEEELSPYRTLINEGYAESIMTSHIVNKNLDPSQYPGTMSSKIITDLLRKRLNYNGVVFTDDMQMHAISKHYGVEEAIKLTILAGVDILTFSNNISGSQERTVDKVHSIIRKFVEEGVIPKERIDESYRRIMMLKKMMGNTDSDFYRQKLEQTEQQSAAYREQALRFQKLAMDNEMKITELTIQLLEEQAKSEKRKKKN